MYAYISSKLDMFYIEILILVDMWENVPLIAIASKLTGNEMDNTCHNITHVYSIVHSEFWAIKNNMINIFV